MHLRQSVLLQVKVMLLCATVALLVGGCFAPPGQTWQVDKGAVYDGDTFRAHRGSETIKVRLCGIDAPEKQQRLGIAARDQLRALLAGGQVRLVPTDRDRYGRVVAEAFTPNGSLINAEMVCGGWAWQYPTYLDKCPHRRAIAQAAQQAKAAHRGVFRPGNQPPWEWRHRHQHRQRSASRHFTGASPG